LVWRETYVALHFDVEVKYCCKKAQASAGDVREVVKEALL